jgi:diguanylate cyclase (GGDEF)-like protein
VITRSQDGSAEDDGRRSVLVVDDDDSSRKLLKALLVPLGVDVTEAVGGGAALEILTAPDHNIDLVLLDMMMPVVDGVTVLKTLAERSVVPALLVLVITAHDDRGLRQRALEAGAVDFITKPVDGIELLAKCKTMLELSRQRRVLQEHRMLAEMRYRFLADSTGDIVVCLRGSEVVWISPSVETWFGDPPEQWIGTDMLRRVHPEDVDIAVAALREVAQGELSVARVRLATTGGGYRWTDGQGKPNVDDEGNTDGVIGVFRVVDDKVEAERLALLDPLTGLVNHREAITRLEKALGERRLPGSKLGVLFCDLDHFKTINDTRGHLVGDVVLSVVATRVRDCVRDADMVGRAGGDEMLILLNGLHDLDEVSAIAEKIRCRAAEPICHNGTTIHVTLSIGGTLSRSGESARSVIARADTAMYQAKQAGRNASITLAPPEDR